MKRKFQKMKIRTRMMLCFSIPLVIIAVMLSVITFHMIARRYETQTIYSANQTFNQAASYLENHISNMYYIQLLIGSNEALMEILRDGAFENKAIDEQYREYWELNDIIASIDLSNGIYHCALYVPDALIYAEDNYHFFPLSQLPEEMDWKDYAGLYSGTRFFTGVQRVQTGYKNQTQQQVAMLKTVYSDGNQVCVARVGVNVEELEDILQNADSTKKGATILINQQGELLASSNNGEEQDMQSDREFLLTLADTEGTWRTVRDERHGRYMLRAETIDEAGWKLVSIIEPLDFYEDVMTVLLILTSFVLLMLAAIITVSYILSGSFTRRLTKLSDQMQQMQQGDWTLEKSNVAEDEIGKLFSQFYYMKDEIRKLMLEQYKLGKNVKVAELRALQAQINPHFLYNTLDLINWEAREYGANEIVEIVQSLAKFYRISLNKGRELVTVRDEIAHVQAYVKIENYHFDNQIFFQIQIQEEVLDCACMNIMLQPFVENAIMHGIAKDSSIEACHILLQVYEENQKLIFEITDDGPGMTKEQMDNIFQPNTSEITHGYGAQNINFRIKLLFGDEYNVRYESKLEQGTKVIITIPKLSMEEAEQQAGI